MKKQTFADLGKHEAIKQLYEASGFINSLSEYQTNIGENIIQVHSVFVEGIDFDLIYFPLKHLGYKIATAISAKAIAAMAKCRLLNIVLGVSAKLDFEDIKLFWEGFCIAAKEHGYQHIDLDLVPSNNGLNISVSATASIEKEIVKHKQIAQSKDLICVSGNIGAAYLGLQLLEKEKIAFLDSGSSKKNLPIDKYKMIISSYLKPEVDNNLINRLKEAELIPSFSYLCNKGLAYSVKQLSEDSGLGAKIYTKKIPFEGNSISLCKELNIDPISAAMNGGEDYKFIFVFPINKMEVIGKNFPEFEIIGHLAQSNVGAVLVSPEGAELSLKAQGWKD